MKEAVKPSALKHYIDTLRNVFQLTSAVRTGTSAPARVAPVATGVNLRRRRPAYKRGGSPSLRGVLWTLVPFVPVVAGVR